MSEIDNQNAIGVGDADQHEHAHQRHDVERAAGEEQHQDDAGQARRDREQDDDEARAEISAGNTETLLPPDSRAEGESPVNGISADSPAWAETRRSAVEAIQRLQRVLESMHAEDKKEAVKLQQEIELAVGKHDSAGLRTALKTVEELLFFVESA